MSIKKWDLNDTKSFFDLCGYKLIGEFKNSNCKSVLLDSNGYYYYSSLNNLQTISKRQNRTPTLKKFYPTNPFTIYNIKHWLKLNKPDFTLKSTDYSGIQDKLLFEDKEGYLYYVHMDNLTENSNCNRFDKSNPYTIQNIKIWCKLNNKDFELISETYTGACDKLIYKCLKDSCGETFDITWHEILKEQGCPFCAGVRVGKSNCLATKNPELVSEWHPTKNRDITPFDVTYMSGKSVWWQCRNNPKHEWQAIISNRSHGDQCPYCTHKLPSEDYNLLICNPQLASEWYYDKNKRRPENYLPYNNSSVWWKCKECGHEWEAKIRSRNSNNSGCPECLKSNGEKRCKEIFISKNFIEINQESYDKLLNYNNIYFISQKSFDGLIGVGNGLLSYDFYLPQYCLLIEYQGEFHDGKVGKKAQSNNKLKRQQEHDKRKKEYALLNGYNFLEIWYWDFNNIEEILEKELKRLEKNKKKGLLKQAQ